MSARGGTGRFCFRGTLKRGLLLPQRFLKDPHISIQGFFWLPRQPVKELLTAAPSNRFPLQAVGPARDSGFLRPQHNSGIGGVLQAMLLYQRWWHDGLGKWVHSYEFQPGWDDRAREEGCPAVVERKGAEG